MPIKRKYILVLIIGAGLVFRLLGMVNISLGGDFEYHWRIAGLIARGESYPILGPAASISPEFHLGPLYYYLLAIPYFLGSGNYKIAIIFFSLLNSLSIYLLFKLVRNWFDEDKSLKITTIYALSSYMITVGNFPWNAYLVPLTVILLLYVLVKINKGQHKHVVPLGLIYGLALQTHATALFLAPLILVYVPFRKIRLKTLLFSLILFVITLLPWLVNEVGSGFYQTSKVVSTIYASESQECNFFNWLENHGHGERCFHYFRNTLFIFRLFSMSIFANTNIAVVIFLVVLSLYTLLATKHPYKRLFILWLFTVFLLYLFYPANIYLHYMLILIPLPYIIMILFMERITKLTRTEIPANIIFYLLIINNLIHFLISLGITRS